MKSASVTLTLDWSYNIPLCSTYHSLPKNRISFKSHKLLWTDGQTDIETGFIRSTPRSQPNKLTKKVERTINEPECTYVTSV